MSFRTTALAVISLCVSGCGAMPNRASVSALPAGAFGVPDTGIVVFSAGAPDHCISTSTFLNVHDSSSDKTVSVPPIGVDVYVHKSDFSDIMAWWMHCTSIRVPITSGPWSQNPYVQSISIPTFQFEVLPGETSYLGEVFMIQSCSFNTSFVVNDQYERDMRVAAEKNPAVTGQPVVRRLMRGGRQLQAE
jgi:hypothetical protein